MAFKPAPLNTAFFATSIIGFLISIFYIYPKTVSWGFAFALVFALMFIASLISMRRAGISSQLPKRMRQIKKKK
jgi:multisubunit Na+/H+ antiporter MnhB subunit